MEDYFKIIKNQIDALHNNSNELNQIVELLREKIANGNNIWIIGNGGSASTSDHFETDLNFIKNNDNQVSIRAQSLTSNLSLITAIANDIGYEKIFSHQLMRKAKVGDLIFIISASGNSQNLIHATLFAKANNLDTFALLGFDGGHLIKLVDNYLLIKTEIGFYGQVEDIQLSICHAVASELKKRLF